jgi:hypothetical protein
LQPFPCRIPLAIIIITLTSVRATLALAGFSLAIVIVALARATIALVGFSLADFLLPSSSSPPSYTASSQTFEASQLVTAKSQLYWTEPPLPFPSLLLSLSLLIVLTRAAFALAFTTFALALGLAIIKFHPPCHRIFLMIHKVNCSGQQCVLFIINIVVIVVINTSDTYVMIDVRGQAPAKVSFARLQNWTPLLQFAKLQFCKMTVLQ